MRNTTEKRHRLRARVGQRRGSFLDESGGRREDEAEKPEKRGTGGSEGGGGDGPTLARAVQSGKNAEPTQPRRPRATLTQGTHGSEADRRELPDAATKLPLPCDLGSLIFQELSFSI